jgi:mRNA interferase MazF
VRGREQGGLRPVPILSHEVCNQRSGTVIALALTSREPTTGFPMTLELRSVRLPSVRGASQRSWIKIGQVRTLSVERVGARLGQVSPEELAEVVEGMLEIVG